MTDADIIAAAKGLVRVSDTTLDALWAKHLNRIYRSYCRRRDWPWLLKLDQTLSLLSGTQVYDLPADFDRFAADSLFYDVTGSAGAWVYNGNPLPILSAGSLRQNGAVANWQAASSSGNPAPQIVSLQGKSGGLLQARFTPTPNAAKTVLYGYYRRPATLDGSGVTIELDPLAETLTYALAKEMCLYHTMRGGTGENQTAFFADGERKEYNMALRILNAC